MISLNKNLTFVTFQIVTPNLKSFNINQKLLIVNVILNYCKNYFFKKKTLDIFN